MWKKKLIFFVTFIAGLYYMLEFIVPPTMPNTTISGIVKSVSSKVIDEKSKTSEVTVQLETFKKNTRIEVSDKKVTWFSPEGDVQVKISLLRATYIIDLGDGTRGIVTGTNSAFVKIGVLGGPIKTITTKATDGKSPILAFKVDDSGGEKLIENPGEIAQNDLLTKIGHTTYLTSYMTDINNFIIVLGALAWGYALFSLWFIHSSALMKRTGDWWMSILFFLGLIFGIIAGTGNGITEPTTIWQAWRKFFDDIVSLYIAFAFFSATYSILSFYLASAAYRSFKAKSKEAIFMMASAMIVMLGQIPFGVYLTSWIPGSASKTFIPQLSQWLQLVPNTAAVRGIWFGVMVASMAISLRFWLSLERGAFFDREL